MGINLHKAWSVRAMLRNPNRASEAADARITRPGALRRLLVVRFLIPRTQAYECRQP